MVLIYVESPSGKIKKNALEALTYGYKAAQQMGTQAVALTIGAAEGAEGLAAYGASKVFNVDAASFDSQQFAAIISDTAKSIGAKLVVMSHSSSGKSLLGRVAVRLEAGSVAGITGLFEGDNVKKNVFSGKAVAHFNITTAVKVVSVMGNSFQPVVISEGATCSVEKGSSSATSRVKVRERKTVEGVVPLPEAELVVSAGRGMKGPENWGIVEDLANVIGATTACSRPVADIHWRPHHEHVGQTGVAIRPNLYIAIGISGAIQHLAGVNQSKVIVVINKDPEAPFFKAADYGVVGDLFDIVPRLTEAIKKFKAAQA